MQDLRLAVRTLLATPLTSAVAVLSLALGIGANTAIFSLVNALLLRSLPVHAPERLVTITSESALRLGLTAGAGWDLAMWRRLREKSDAFAGALAWSVERFDLARGGERQPVDGLLVDGDFFTTLGVPALLGRTFTAADDVAGGGPDGPVAVISHGLWQRRFGAAVDVIGRPLVMADTAFTIVGVLPPEFFGLDVGRTFDVAVPSEAEAVIRPTPPGVTRRFSFPWLVALRLKDGQSRDAAAAALRALQPHILGVEPAALATFQPGFLAEPYVLASAEAGISYPRQGTSGLRQRYRRPLLTLLVVVALVLLVACANIANLLLARASARRGELSLRLALGASPWRLARQLFSESLMLASAGGLAGLVLAWWGSRLLVAGLSTPDARVVMDQVIDVRVLLFTAAVCVSTAVLFGVAPVRRAMRVAPIEALREAVGRASHSWSVSRLSSALVVAQAALSLVLIVAAGLFVGSFTRLTGADLGFDKDRLLVVSVDTRRVPRASRGREAFYQELVDAARAAPGVAQAAGAWRTPVGGYRQTFRIDIAGLAPGHDSRAAANIVTPSWFATYGLPLRKGRDFDARDTPDAPPVLIVNEAFARRFFPGVDALGQRVAEPGNTTRTIVGVVSDAVYGSVRDGAPPTMYLAMAQSAGIGPPDLTSVTITARALAGAPAMPARSIGAAIAVIDPGLAFSVRPLADDLHASFTQERMVAGLSGFFGGLALLLAALGLYGVTSHAVTARRHEIGVRLALGAERAAVVRLVVGRALLLVGLGAIVGGVGSAWLSRLVTPLLYGLEPRDPVVFAVAALILLGAGALAAWLPAARAGRIDPAEVLRNH
jgi:putative ABC transport system permease protein